MSRSPFLVIQDFITGDEAVKIAEQVRVTPLPNDDGTLQNMERHHKEAEKGLFEKFEKTVIPQLEIVYDGFKYKGTEHMVFQQFQPSNSPPEPPRCENAVFKRKKWVRVRERDLTGILWLKDYQDEPPFDLKTQVLGGKLEFPVYNFGLQPQRGTLVMYPANEKFIFLTTPILVGELQCVRINVVGEGFWLYDHDKYPGDYTTWFSHIV